MADKSQAPINSLAAYLIALLGIGLAAFMVIGSLASFGAVSDVPEFYAGSWMILQHNAAQIYNLPVIFAIEKQFFPSLGARGIGLFVPPPGVLLLTPLAFLPAGLVAALWTFLLTASLAVSLWLIIRHLSLSRQESLWLIGIVFLSGPAVEGLRLGQLAPLMLLALTAVMVLAERRPYLAGAVLDFLIVKPQQLFPLLLFFLSNMRKQLVAASIIGLLLLLVLAELVFGTAGMTLYLVTVSDPQNLQLMQPELTPTVRGQLMRLLGMHSPAATVMAGVALLAAAVVIALIAWRSRNRAYSMNLCLAACLPLGLLTSLHCHDYDLLLLLPGLALLTRTVMWRKLSDWTKAAFMIGVGAFVLPFYNDIHYGYLLHGGTINPHFLLLLAFALSMVLAALKNPQDFAFATDNVDDNAAARTNSSAS